MASSCQAEAKVTIPGGNPIPLCVSGAAKGNHDQSCSTNPGWTRSWSVLHWSMLRWCCPSVPQYGISDHQRRYHLCSSLSSEQLLLLYYFTLCPQSFDIDSPWQYLHHSLWLVWCSLLKCVFSLHPALDHPGVSLSQLITLLFSLFPPFLFLALFEGEILHWNQEFCTSYIVQVSCSTAVTFMLTLCPGPALKTLV